MNAFVARQAILDGKQGLFGYELLFRDSDNNNFQIRDGDAATLEVINNSFINIGMGKVTNGKKAFINFTENLLMSDIFTILSPEDVVVELLETVNPTEEVIQRCKNLKKKGYTIALDDFAFVDKYKRLMDVIDIIKVDFRLTNEYSRKMITKDINSAKIRFLAEKVETVEEHNEAVAYGYSYFQGYYFSRPVSISAKRVPENKLIYLKILRELNNTDFSIENIERLIKKDVSLTYKLLKLINSAKYSLVSTIGSIRQALAFLGEVEVKKWLYVISVKSIGSYKPEWVVTETLIRARFSELLALKAGFKDKAFNAYLIGILARIDVLLDMPLAEVLSELLVPLEVKDVLIDNKKNDLGAIHSIIKAYEAADWDTVKKYLNEINIRKEELADAYIDSIQWATTY